MNCRLRVTLYFWSETEVEPESAGNDWAEMSTAVYLQCPLETSRTIHIEKRAFPFCGLWSGDMEAGSCRASAPCSLAQRHLQGILLFPDQTQTPQVAVACWKARMLVLVELLGYNLGCYATLMNNLMKQDITLPAAT